MRSFRPTFVIEEARRPEFVRIHRCAPVKNFCVRFVPRLRRRKISHEYRRGKKGGCVRSNVRDVRIAKSSTGSTRVSRKSLAALQKASPRESSAHRCYERCRARKPRKSSLCIPPYVRGIGKAIERSPRISARGCIHL